MALLQTGRTEPVDPTRQLATAALISAGTLVVSLAGINFVLRNHKHGLRAEPKGQGPGPKHD